MKRKSISAFVVTLIVLLSTTLIADARPARNSRKRQLARGVEAIATAYHEETGGPLPVNDDTLAVVMEYIGATPDEATFVYDRMQAYSQATEAIEQADQTINQMQDFLNCLNTQGTGCIP